MLFARLSPQPEARSSW